MHDEQTRSLFPFLDLLERHAPAIREEVLSLQPEMWCDMPGYPGVQVFVLASGIWKGGYAGVAEEANRARCPHTVAVLSRIPGLEMAGFLRVPPRVRMRKHTDPRDDHVVRCHLGLVLPRSEQAWWKEGTARLMDPRRPHWALNDDDCDRLTLVLDVRMPFVVSDDPWGPWRPDDPPDEEGGGDVQDERGNMQDDIRQRHPWIETMERTAEAIRAEADALAEVAFVSLPSYPDGVGAYLLDAGPWSHQFRGVDIAANRARCPAAVHALAAVENIVFAGILRVAEGVSFEAERPAVGDAVRFELGLRLPRSEQHREGRVFVVERGCSVRSDPDRCRVTLFFEVRNPPRAETSTLAGGTAPDAA